MKNKLKKYLQSNTTILLVALVMGCLCHYFVTSEIMESDKNEKPFNLYLSAMFKTDQLKKPELNDHVQIN